MIGTVISNYRIIKLLGEGGMGSVYLAEHVQLSNIKYAIKALHSFMVSNDQVRERFRRGAAMLSSIQHDNIVKIHDYIENSDGSFLIMEFVDGSTLEDYILNISGPLNIERVYHVMSRMLDGFGYAHDMGMIHRDVKPANVIISNDLSILKILDFDIAKIQNETSGMTKHGSQMGTVYYMSPEQVKGQSMDARSDIYSLGVSLYQMVTAVNPYQHLTTEYEVFHEIVNNPLPDPRITYPGVNEGIVAIIQKATQKDPANRYPSCAAMKQALSDVLQGNVQPVKTTTSLNPVEFVGSSGPKKPIGEAPPIVDQGNGTRKAPIVLYSVLGVLLLAFIILAANFKSIKHYYKWKDAQSMVCYIPSLRIRSDTNTTSDYNILPVSANYGDVINVIDKEALYPWMETNFREQEGLVNTTYLMSTNEFNLLSTLLNSEEKQKQVVFAKHRKSLTEHVKTRLNFTSYQVTVKDEPTDPLLFTDSTGNGLASIYEIDAGVYMKKGTNSFNNRNYSFFLVETNNNGNIITEFVMFVYDKDREINKYIFSDWEDTNYDDINNILFNHGLSYY